MRNPDVHLRAMRPSVSTWGMRRPSIRPRSSPAGTAATPRRSLPERVATDPLWRPTCAPGLDELRRFFGGLPADSNKFGRVPEICRGLRELVLVEDAQRRASPFHNVQFVVDVAQDPAVELGQ